MLNDEIISIVSRFFDGGKGPSHDELTRMFRRAGLEAYDPSEPGSVIGKMKRCREVLSQALDEDIEGGEKLIKMIIGTIKANGGFRSSSESFAGQEIILSIKQAFKDVGHELDSEGNLKPFLLESLQGKDLTNALKTYVNRARKGSEDAALVVGTGKDLLEATARHIIQEKTGSYDAKANFQMTLYQAYERLEMTLPDLKLIQQLDSQNATKAFEQALFLLGNAINRLRNSDGTGHGRPFISAVTDNEAKIAIQSMGIVSEMLLMRLEK